MDLQNRVHLADELHSDIDRAFGDGASELCDLLVMFWCWGCYWVCDAYLEVIGQVVVLIAWRWLCGRLVGGRGLVVGRVV
jgi:hypothetical protein